MAVLALATLCANAGFMLIGPIVAAVVPYRLRTQGYAMVGVYVFLSGAFLGAVLAGLMSDAWGVRTGLSLLCIPSALIGGALLASGAAHIRGDIGRVMEELEEERAEAARVRDHDAEDHVLQVRNLDFSYGAVQVLFGVDLDVRRGEVLALLGTNGAGKSTLLRCICGLGVPSRGTVRLHGHTVTYAEPEAPGAARHRDDAGRQRAVGPAHRRGEPPPRRLRAAQRRRRAPAAARPGAGAVPRAARPPRPAGRHAVGRPEADGGAGQGDAARARGAAHRRAVARPVARSPRSRCWPRSSTSATRG